MNFNELPQNIGMWVLVLAGLVALWIVGSIPVMIRNKGLEKGWKLSKWLDDHIVIAEIVWIGLLVFLARYIKL